MIGPAAVLMTSFWSGSLVDRRNKRILLVALNGFRAAIILLLPFTDSLLVIYLIVFILGIAGAMFEPASMAYVAMLLKPEQRRRFNAFRSLATSGAFLVGPAAAGLRLPEDDGGGQHPAPHRHQGHQHRRLVADLLPREFPGHDRTPSPAGAVRLTSAGFGGGGSGVSTRGSGGGSTRAGGGGWGVACGFVGAATGFVGVATGGGGVT